MRSGKTTKANRTCPPATGLSASIGISSRSGPPDAAALSMKVLFIGGTGNISAECATLCAEQGHEIFVVSRGRSAVPPQYHSIQGDRKDLAGLRAALRGMQPDVVIDFLGYERAEVEGAYQLF